MLAYLCRKIRHMTNRSSKIALWIVLIGTQTGFACAAVPGIDFVTLPAGEFVMGNPNFDDTVIDLPDGDVSQIADERPARRVRITRPFELSRTEITQAQWLSVMHTRPGPAEYWKRKDWKRLPVVSVTWHDAQRFMAALNRSAGNKHYRLPTEAEWEYAARAGSSSDRGFPADQLDEYAWYLGNSGDHPHPVAQRRANAWALYDMLGNAWEWVADRYQADYYEYGSDTDPTGPNQGEKRVRRGGSYHCQPHLVRVNYRAADTPDTRYSVIGFRVLREDK